MALIDRVCYESRQEENRCYKKELLKIKLGFSSPKNAKKEIHIQIGVSCSSSWVCI